MRSDEVSSIVRSRSFDTAETDGPAESPRTATTRPGMSGWSSRLAARTVTTSKRPSFAPDPKMDLGCRLVGFERTEPDHGQRLIVGVEELHDADRRSARRRCSPKRRAAVRLVHAMRTSASTIMMPSGSASRIPCAVGCMAHPSAEPDRRLEATLAGACRKPHDRDGRIDAMPMRENCKNFESRTYRNGDTVRKCNLDLAPEAPGDVRMTAPRSRPGSPTSTGSTGRSSPRPRRLPPRASAPTTASGPSSTRRRRSSTRRDRRSRPSSKPNDRPGDSDPGGRLSGLTSWFRRRKGS